MSSPNEQLAKDWWAEGDTPVHNDSHVTYFVDGRILVSIDDQATIMADENSVCQG